jgi:hypothetical protein
MIMRLLSWGAVDIAVSDAGDVGCAPCAVEVEVAMPIATSATDNMEPGSDVGAAFMVIPW